MQPVPAIREPIRFGVFEIVPSTGELRKAGVRIRVQDQPFRLLLILLEHPGELVTREVLKEALAPAASFGDFDHMINAAIAKLRTALGDSADTPRYIETIPRRGYRFIFPIQVEQESPPGPVPEARSAVTEKQNRKYWIVAFVGVLTVAALAAGWWGLHRPKPVAKIQSIAVLPLANFSRDPEQEYFADGMTDELITDLSKVRALTVISRTSAMRYKATNKSLPEIARELKVDAVVEGSVQRSGNRVRITAQLIDPATERHLWAETYEREMTDVLALQSEMVQAIAGEIRAQVTPQESERFKTTRRIDPEVYDTTLKGKATLEYATREEQLRQAIELFQKAVDRDPTYAPAWAGLAEGLWSLAGTGWESVAPAEVRDKAIAAAEKALALDGTLPDAYNARALVALYGEWDVAKAQQHFERALELRPSYASAHNWYGQMLGGTPLQRFDEARRHLDRARELDPLSPWNNINLVGWWLFQGRLERAF